MREKFLLGKFGVCPRVLCERQAVLPIGMSEELRTSRVKVLSTFSFEFCSRKITKNQILNLLNRSIAQDVKMCIFQRKNVQMSMELISDALSLTFYYKYRNNYAQNPHTSLDISRSLS